MDVENEFDVYCSTKKIIINDAAYALIAALTSKSAVPRKFEFTIPQWDDRMIADVVESAIAAIDERIGYYCHPHYQDDDLLPCYLGDRCDNPHCAFKHKPATDGLATALPSRFSEGGEDDV